MALVHRPPIDRKSLRRVVEIYLSREPTAKRIHRIIEFRFHAIVNGIQQVLYGRGTGIVRPSDPRLNLPPILLSLQKKLTIPGC